MSEAGENITIKEEVVPKSEGLAQGPKKRLNIGGITRKVRDAFRDEFGGVRKMPPEEIGDSTVAYTIWRHLRNPFIGDIPGENPFTIQDVMANAGYTGIWRNTDTMKKFPDVYPKFRLALTNLSREGIIETEQMIEPDTHGEILRYYIPNDEIGPERQQRLEEFASQAQQINPKYKIAA